MALHPIHDEDPRLNYPHLLHSLVFHEAVKIVKEQIRKRGDNLRQYALKDIRALADEYLEAEANRELLMIDTILKIRREPSLQRLAEAEAKRRARERPKPPNPRRALQLLEKALKR
jgi:hypothetical protein